MNKQDQKENSKEITIEKIEIKKEKQQEPIAINEDKCKCINDTWHLLLPDGTWKDTERPCK